MFILFHIYTLMQFYLHSVNAEEFNYEDTYKWNDHYPDCGHSSQSPINLKLGQILKINELPALSWINYDMIPVKMTLVNNGHSITLTGLWPPGQIPSISGGPLSDLYVFEQLHFHWGPNNSIGSEHTINGNSFPLEMHMVHYKSQYITFQNATNFQDGLAVVGFFFDIDIASTFGLARVLGGVAGVQIPGGKVELDPFPLSGFHVTPISVQFVTYTGSLTTPPCSEIVTWILPIAILKVTAKTMDKFRTIQLNHNDKYNYRSTQPLNDRKIRILTQWSKFYMSEVYEVLRR